MDSSIGTPEGVIVSCENDDTGGVWVGRVRALVLIIVLPIKRGVCSRGGGRSRAGLGTSKAWSSRDF